MVVIVTTLFRGHEPIDIAHAAHMSDNNPRLSPSFRPLKISKVVVQDSIHRIAAQGTSFLLSFQPFVLSNIHNPEYISQTSLN